MSDRPWTKKEDDKLLKNSGLPAAKLGRLLGRRAHEVLQRRSELGLAGPRDWPAEHIRFLKDNPRMTAAKIAKRIGKSESAVHGARHRYGISGYVWSQEDDQFLVDNPGMPASEIAARLERTVNAVHGRRKALGVSSTKRNLWTLKQIQFVRENPDMRPRDIAARIGKTVNGVIHRRAELGMTKNVKHTKWSPAEDAYVVEWSSKMRAKDIANRLDRTVASIHVRQKHLGLGRTREELKWTEREIKFLWDNPRMSAVEISKKLGKTPGAVRSTRRKQGLPKLQEKNPWTKEELDIVRKNQHLKREEIHMLFPGRSKTSVDGAMIRVGRPRRNRKGMRLSSGYKDVDVAGTYIQEHRLVAERKIGRLLKPSERVHHIDHDKRNNKPDNLDVLSGQSAHMKAEASIAKVVPILLKSGALIYDRDTHEYRIPKKSG